MNFGTPWALLGLVPAVFLAVFMVVRERERKRLAEAFMASPMLARLAEQYRPRQAAAVLGLRLLAVVFLVLALASPQWGSDMVKVERQGLDIFFAVDCSKSMAAQDLKPTRMDAAKRELSVLIDRLSENRMGLVGFAGSAFVFCPLTLDQGAARMFLRQLDQDAVQIPGTAMGDAIRLALQNFTEEDTAKVIILITDGEDHHSEPLAAADEAAARGVVIYTVGVGQAQGSPIPTVSGGYLTDKDGNTVVSKLDEETLKQIAHKTGGRYVRVDGAVDPLEPVVDAIGSSERRALESQMVLRFQERYQIFVGLALIFLTLAQVLEQRKRLES